MRQMRKAKLAAALLALAGVLATESQAATLTVTTTAFTMDAADKKCSFAEAISSIRTSSLNSNCPNTGLAFGTSDAIEFMIDGATDAGCTGLNGVCTIAPTYDTYLDLGGRAVTIDGSTQPGWSANTQAIQGYPNALGINTQIRIELDGRQMTAGHHGITLASNSTIRGVAIFNFPSYNLSGIDNNRIEGSFIGIRADGVTLVPGNTPSINIDLLGSGNVIGGVAAATRNLVAGIATLSDINIRGTNNLIRGNLIGSERTGTVAASFTVSANHGVLVNSNQNTIEKNVIVDHGGDGINLVGASNNTIFDNAIGIGVGGQALGNGRYEHDPSPYNGIAVNTIMVLAAASSSNLIYNNGIANNQGNGILVAVGNGQPPSGNRLDRNAIFDNGELGIDLQAAGDGNGLPTANDAAANLDGDTGPNGLQNYPVITSAVVNGTGGVDIAYTLDSAPNSVYAISAYASDSCNPTGYGQGRHLANVPLSWSTDGAGHLAQRFSYGSMPAGWAVGKWVTLLAVDAVSGDTSEFSPCVRIAAPTMPRAPTLLRLVPGNHLIRVLFAPPTSDGGSPITSYTATCRNGAATYSATAVTSPITVVGLDNGTTYTCSIHAGNVFGAGAESAASSRVVRPPSPLSVLTTVLGD